jgi:hypothetical protein
VEKKVLNHLGQRTTTMGNGILLVFGHFREGFVPVALVWLEDWVPAKRLRVGRKSRVNYAALRATSEQNNFL